MKKRKSSENKSSKKTDTPKTSQKKTPTTPTILKNLPQNYWAISTIVLAILLIATLLTGSTTGSIVSPETAGQNVLDFAKNQGANAELISTSDDGSLYEVILSIEGQEVPVYVTKDGKTLVPQPISLEIKETPSTAPSTAPSQVPKSEKPKVELFVMSICPYGTQAEKGILPVINLLGDKIDFDLKFVSYAMHDKPEIDENSVQYCVQKEEPEKLTKYLGCYLEKQDTAFWDSCIDTVGLDRAKIESCVEELDAEFKITELYNDRSTWSDGRFPQYPVEKEENTKYGVGGSPTLIINGAKSNAGRSATSYLAGICAAFENAPEECSEDLSSLGTPAPGFGFGTQGGSATTAGCGV